MDSKGEGKVDFYTLADKLDSPDTLEEVALELKKDFPIVHTGIDDNGKWGVRPLEYDFFLGIAGMAIAAIKRKMGDVK